MLKRYIDQFASLECAKSYHIFSWLAAVSMCMGRRCWVDRGFFTTYPNIYVALVGEAGSGKSVAMYQARDLIESVNKQLPKEDRMVLAPKCSSARKFMSILAAQQTVFKIGDKSYTHAPICCFLSELSNFIQLDPNFTLNFLTDSYDDKYFDYETEHKGGCRIDGPAPVVLACTTHNYITTKLRDDVISDGASRRFHWILDERSEQRNAEPERPPLDQILVDRLMGVRKMIGPFQWSDDGKAAYKEWYDNNDRKDFGLTGYGTTKNVKIEKMAMLLAASERLEKVIRAEDINMSLELCLIMEKNLSKVFEGVGRNQLNAAVSSLIFLLSSNKGRLPETKARQHMYRQINAREFDEVLNHLVKSHRVSKSGENSACILTLLEEKSEDRPPSPKANKPHPKASDQVADHPLDDENIQTGL